MAENEKPISSSTPINTADVLKRCRQNPRIVVKLLESFGREAPRSLEQLSQAIVSGDLDQVAHSAHSLKGAAANVSAEALADLARELEEKTKNQDLEGAAAYVDLLQVELNRCIEFLPVALNGLRETTA